MCVEVRGVFFSLSDLWSKESNLDHRPLSAELSPHPLNVYLCTLVVSKKRRVEKSSGSHLPSTRTLELITKELLTLLVSTVSALKHSLGLLLCDFTSTFV